MSRKKIDSVDRALNIAIEMLIERGFDSVSIADIAKASRCSTATLYDVFGTKEGLLSEVIERGNASWSPPILAQPRSDEMAFEALLKYLVLRIEYLNSPRSGGLLRAAIARRERGLSAFAKLNRTRDQLHNMTVAVEAAIRDGQLRAIDAQAMAYSILSASSFEALISTVTLGHQVDPFGLIRTVLLPMVTDAGMEYLDDWLVRHRGFADGETKREKGAGNVSLGLHRLSPRSDTQH